MEYPDLIDQLAEKSDSTILLAVLDGLGDYGIPELDGRTPLEAADTPSLDALARRSAAGAHVPIARGVTPGSGPAHLALFGYDPVRYMIGRGTLAALGIGFDLHRGDLAARINFCTVDSDGTVTDRRAGRIPTEVNREIVEELASAIESIDGVDVFLRTVKEHRACVVFRGEGLSDSLRETDPGITGRAPLPADPLEPAAERSAAIVREFIERSTRALAGKNPANMLLLRGFSCYSPLPSMQERFLLSPAAVALYPMYRGVASLVGMDVMEPRTSDLAGEIEACTRALSAGHDFVFLHHKPTDSAGEDGDCRRKIEAIEQFDRGLEELLDAGFDVVAVTGDHSTPCGMKLHSWHPVPLLIYGGCQRAGYCSSFGERDVLLSGSLGIIRAVDLLPLLLASAGKLRKFGA